jgi:type IV secretory pathway VirB6-like protein
VEIDARASKELTAVQTDYLQYIFQAINTLLTQNLGFFDTMGQNLFRSFATILIAWYGIKSALSAASGKHPFHFDNFASLLLTISFGFAMVNYYNTPIPGVGTSFHNLVTDEAQFLSSQIDQAQLQTVVTQVADFESRMDSPTWGDVLGTLIYVIVTILLAAAQAVAIVVIAYGFIATAVCVLVGPVFVPFFIVPKMEWLFWGWFRCFIQYAFYQVIASAVVYIIGNLILGALQLPPAGTLSTVQLIAWFPVLFITFLASIYALLKIPALTNHIFSGTAGGSSAGILERVFG